MDPSMNRMRLQRETSGRVACSLQHELYPEPGITFVSRECGFASCQDIECALARQTLGMI